MQFPSGMGYFRPDLNFEGTSEREIEVREPSNTVDDICSKSQTIRVDKVKLWDLIKLK